MEEVYVYFVGKVVDFDTEKMEFQGIFDSEQKATDACIDECYFWCRTILNKQLPNETYLFNSDDYCYPKRVF